MMEENCECIFYREQKFVYKLLPDNGKHAPNMFISCATLESQFLFLLVALSQKIEKKKT